ncbi:hypothetical protein EVAR_55800_1 [Eumeta japonica]|uniref:Uncharacterized protein n=1 Tax=Eumeta variegata TaxID=151549 RepID=A0A4C1YUB5_EUMVA|nr:hypothetical protein EVAR_55800_1 [Eumeta japonica]
MCRPRHYSANKGRGHNKQHRGCKSSTHRWLSSLIPKAPNSYRPTTCSCRVGDDSRQHPPTHHSPRSKLSM